MAAVAERVRNIASQRVVKDARNFRQEQTQREALGNLIESLKTAETLYFKTDIFFDGLPAQGCFPETTIITDTQMKGKHVNDRPSKEDLTSEAQEIIAQARLEMQDLQTALEQIPDLSDFYYPLDFGAEAQRLTQFVVSWIRETKQPLNSSPQETGIVNWYLLKDFKNIEDGLYLQETIIEATREEPEQTIFALVGKDWLPQPGDNGKGTGVEIPLIEIEQN